MELLTVPALIAVAAIAGALGIVALARPRAWTAAAGVLLVVAAGFLPPLAAFGFGPALAGIVLGGAAAALWKGWRASARKRAALGVAVAWLAIEPLGVLTAYQIRADETFDRCSAGKAIAIVEASRAAGRGYPTTMNEISLQDDSYGTGCYVSRGTNWLYRVGPGATYTLGYWVDWRVVRRVCLYSPRGGWSCGFESWGPFRPGELD